mmetsp:Transcript_0/g.3  ORF Transcript_0/g.3 Transcript_0/m.3 type:complete len:206 (-) Transcript_0:99-716(-)
MKMGTLASAPALTLSARVESQVVATPWRIFPAGVSYLTTLKAKWISFACTSAALLTEYSRGAKAGKNSIKSSTPGLHEGNSSRISSKFSSPSTTCFLYVALPAVQTMASSRSFSAGSPQDSAKSRRRLFFGGEVRSQCFPSASATERGRPALMALMDALAANTRRPSSPSRAKTPATRSGRFSGSTPNASPGLYSMWLPEMSRAM